LRQKDYKAIPLPNKASILFSELFIFLYVITQLEMTEPVWISFKTLSFGTKNLSWACGRKGYSISICIL